MAVSWTEEVACGPALIALHYQSYLSLIEGFFFSVSLPPSGPGLPPPANVSVLPLLLSVTRFSLRLRSGLFISMQTSFLLHSEDKVGDSKSKLLNNTGGRPSYRAAWLLCVTVCYRGVYWGVDYWLSILARFKWNGPERLLAEITPLLKIGLSIQITQHNTTD